MKPILFSGPMVRAILEGRKTQTRRVIKPQPMYDDFTMLWLYGKKSFLHEGELSDNSPYGLPGDLLWVRETFMEHHGESKVWYKADQSEQSLALLAAFSKWRPSIFMPRWASRITLRLTDVKVERVQDISEADAKAEGVEPVCVPRTDGTTVELYKPAFRTLWDSINLKRGYGWEVNPLVWVLEFKMILPEDTVSLSDAK